MVDDDVEQKHNDAYWETDNNFQISNLAGCFHSLIAVLHTLHESFN